MNPDEMYQLILLHDEQGARVNAVYYDLGWLHADDAVQLAAHLGACAELVYPKGYMGEVTNVLEAWASPEYRCWFLPKLPGEPCCEYIDDEVVLSEEEDPR